MKKRPNAAVRGYLRPQTVKVRKDGNIRIGQDLLGNMAGNRQLRFGISLSGGCLMFRPRIGKLGYPAFYSQPLSKSPFVRMAAFYRLMSMNKIPSGVYRADKCGDSVCVRLAERISK